MPRLPVNFALIIISLTAAVEIATWNFAQDYGENFPDGSGNGYDGTNGPTTLIENENVQ